MQDYTGRPYTTPNTHNPHGIRKDILQIVDSVGHLDNQKGGLWIQLEAGFVLAAAHMDLPPEVRLVAAHMDLPSEVRLVAAHLEFPPEMGVVVAA